MNLVFPYTEKAQWDLLQYIEKELKPAPHQVIYTTHSPFMVDSNHFERVRIVQDRSIDATEPLPREQDGTKVLTDIYDATDDSLFPLQGALGYEIQQTLFIGPHSLIVEGQADMFYLRAISCEMEREGRTGLSEKWVVTPVGGSGKVPTFVALLAPQRGLKIATLLDVQRKDQHTIDNLYKNKLLQKKRVITYADFLNQDEADVEDLFPRAIYLEFVNGEFAGQLKAPIKVADLSAKEPRNVRAIEKFLESKPLKSGTYSHYRPARWFTEHIDDVWPKFDIDTKDRFEKVFLKVNSLL